MTTSAAARQELEAIALDLASACVRGRSGAAAAARARLSTHLARRSGPTLLPRRPAIDAAHLPETPGVYVISSTVGAGHYVGLATDLRHRFYNREYGHLSPNNRSRSLPLITSGSYALSFRAVTTDGADAHTEGTLRLELARREIVTYAELRLAGEHVLNSIAMLGRVGSQASPVILCDYATGEYIYCDSLFAAGRLARSTALPAVVHGYQRTAVGFAARWASDTEAEELAGSCDDFGRVRGPAVAAVVLSQGRIAEWTGEGRNAGFRWMQGGLSDGDLQHLRRYGRARYGTRLPRSRFNGVSWESRSQGWQCRAKTGFGPKDLWQTRRAAWSSDLEAAVFREEKICGEGWQRFNVGRYSSNALALNEALGEACFAPW